MPTAEQIRDTETEEILDRLTRMIRWSDEFRLGFVKCNSPVQQQTMARTLAERIPDIRILEISLAEPLISLLDAIEARWDTHDPPHVIYVYGLEKSISPDCDYSPVLGRLNNDRDLIRRAVPAALLIWLPDFALDCMVQGAPDFWAWRSGVYEFPTDPDLWFNDALPALTLGTDQIASLALEDKRAEVTRIEELLRISEAFPNPGRREKQIRSRLLDQRGLLSLLLGDWQAAQTTYEEALRLAKELDDPAGIATILHQLASLQLLQDHRQEAMRLYEESMAINQNNGDKAGQAKALHQLAMLKQVEGQYDEAERLYRQGLELACEVSDSHGMAGALHQLGRVYENCGDYAEAERLYRESLSIKEKVQDLSGIAATLHQLGIVQQKQGSFAEAERLYQQSLRIKRQLGDALGIALTLGQLGKLAALQGYVVPALYSLGWAGLLFTRLGSPYARLAISDLMQIRKSIPEEEFQAILREKFTPEQRKDLLEMIDSPQ